MMKIAKTWAVLCIILSPIVMLLQSTAILLGKGESGSYFGVLIWALVLHTNCKIYLQIKFLENFNKK